MTMSDVLLAPVVLRRGRSTDLRSFGRRTAVAGVVSITAMLTLGCHDTPAVEDAARIVEGPTLVVDPTGTTPLAAALSLQTDTATRVSLRVTDLSTGAASLIDYQASATDHRDVPVLGFKFDREYRITVEVRNDAGTVTTAGETLSFGPVSPPQGFPPIIKQVVDLDSEDTSVTLVGVSSGGISFPPPKRNTFLIALDHAGDPVWVWRSPGDTILLQVERLDNGNMVVMVFATLLVEIDMLGRIQRAWKSQAFSGVPKLEGVEPLAIPVLDFRNFGFIGDHLFTVTDARRSVPAYPTSETDTSSEASPRDIIEAVVAEFDGKGKLVNSYSMVDMLGNDPGPVDGPSTLPAPATAGMPELDSRPPTLRLKFGYDSLTHNVDFLPGCQSAESPPRCSPWNHANSLSYQAADDTFMLSLMNLDVVLKFRRSDGKLLWLLGNPNAWPREFNPYLLQPNEDLPNFWQYHQHSPTVTSDGTILIFDNGNYRGTPCTAPQRPLEGEPCLDIPKRPADNYSRAVEFKIDLGDATAGLPRTAERIWEFVPNPSDPTDPEKNHFSPDGGTAREIPDAAGKRLVHFGAIMKAFGSRPPLAAGTSLDEYPGPVKTWSRIYHVSRDPNPVTLFDVQIGSSDTSDETSYRSYRARILPALMPPGL